MPTSPDRRLSLDSRHAHRLSLHGLTQWGSSRSARVQEIRRAGVLGALALLLATAAGCGSAGKAGTAGSAMETGTVVRVTVPAYDHYPANTIVVDTSSPRSTTCRIDARGFVAQSRLYLVHEGKLAAYPSDVAYLGMRQGLADFDVRHCDPALLGEALQKLSAKQQAALVSDLPRPMAASVRKALAAVRG